MIFSISFASSGFVSGPEGVEPRGVLVTARASRIPFASSTSSPRSTKWMYMTRGFSCSRWLWRADNSIPLSSSLLMTGLISSSSNTRSPLGDGSAARFYEGSPVYESQCRLNNQISRLDSQVRPRERDLIHLSRQVAFLADGFCDSIDIQLPNIGLGKHFRACRQHQTQQQPAP